MVADFYLDIQIDESFVENITHELIERTVKSTLKITGICSIVDLGLVITDDATVHDLNIKYRNIDSTTDVLSFALTERVDTDDDEFILPPGDIVHLGEVIISYPQAERQAKGQGVSVEREMALLITHGVLHLLGYDHVIDEDEQRMKSVEHQVLDNMGF